MTSTTGQSKRAQQPNDRFLVPETPAADRIDQLVLVDTGQQHLLPRRTSQAEWLKQALALHWNSDLPQPFIGYDTDDGTFFAEWQSETECNTLTIDAESHRGWYDPWPSGTEELPEELDLNTEEAWQFLRNALTATGP